MSSGTNGLKVYNTTVSGQALIASLTGKDILELQYDGAINGMNPLQGLSSGTINSPSVDWLIQGTVAPVPIKHGNTTSASADGFITLGSDTATVARAYLELFNISSTNQVRLVQVVSCDSETGSVYLNNSTGTDTNVIIQNAGGSSAGSQLLISSGDMGTIRSIFVSGNPTSGAQTVTFRIAPEPVAP
jgi:hypothetical protein